MEYYKVVSAIKHYRNKFLPVHNSPVQKDSVQNFLSNSKVCKKFYQHLVNKKASTPSKSQEKSLAEGDIFNNSTVTVNWKNTHYLPFLCTIETKLRVFQFKLVHRIIATNDFLCKTLMSRNAGNYVLQDRYKTSGFLLFLQRNSRNPCSSVLEM